MNDLASVTQAMSTPKYKGMLQALTQFRDQAAQEIVLQLGPHRKLRLHRLRIPRRPLLSPK
ncbi:hypothetical protein JG687_00019074 [Phytophthora cactorum]|uniref:Uncharacterized protein n=1 Tax=Phytophthora cactorum TaxID=29920 RepID=A0A8T1TMF8_9STRA|nr:hypothetical protein JG687_00019074 [Phytophthora cactorum]